MKVLTIICLLLLTGCYTPKLPTTIGVMNCKPKKAKGVGTPMRNRMSNPTLKNRF